MGMFDTVYFDCPRCDNTIEVQSKAGECVLASYRPSEVPAAIADDLTGEQIYCSECGSSYRPYPVRKDTVAMGLLTEGC